MEEPIRVAQIIGKMVGGGVESFIMNYYKHMDRSKIQFDFIVDSDSTYIPKDEIENLGGKIIIVPPYQKLFDYTIELTKILKQNDYKIVHSHLNTLSVIPLYCAWKAHVPVRIAHSHSTSNKKEFKKNLIKNLLRPFSKLFATDFFSCSEYAGRWLFGYKALKKEQISIIHNAIDVEKFKFNESTRKKMRKKLNIENKFVLGHVGRFVKQKNHEFLIDIFNEVYKENKDAVLLLIGEGPDKNKIKEKVDRLKIDNAVYFIGATQNVCDYMQTMDIFVFPSLYEGLGIALIEAQCNGLRCITSNNVPKESKISNTIEFENLKKINNWKLKILNNMSSRNSIDNIMIEKYDINKEAHKLMNKYIDLNKKACIGSNSATKEN